MGCRSEMSRYACLTPWMTETPPTLLFGHWVVAVCLRKAAGTRSGVPMLSEQYRFSITRPGSRNGTRTTTRLERRLCGGCRTPGEVGARTARGGFPIFFGAPQCPRGLGRECSLSSAVSTRVRALTSFSASFLTPEQGEVQDRPAAHAGAAIRGSGGPARGAVGALFHAHDRARLRRGPRGMRASPDPSKVGDTCLLRDSLDPAPQPEARSSGSSVEYNSPFNGRES